jgi:hypothetical protein
VIAIVADTATLLARRETPVVDELLMITTLLRVRRYVLRPAPYRIAGRWIPTPTSRSPMI